MRPNFLLIGAAKAGTTSLHMYLDEHPDVFMSRYKEPGYFAFAGTHGRYPHIQYRPFVTELADYEALFRGSEGHRVRGESSTYYLDYASPGMMAHINETLPDVRTLAVLRQPVDQAYSRFSMWARTGRNQELEFRERFLRDFERYRTLDEDDATGGRVVTRSYACRLKVFFEGLGRDRVKVMLFDDFRADSAGFVREIFRYLEVDDGFEPDLTRRVNEGGVFRSGIAASLFNRPNPIRWLARKVLPDQLRTEWGEATVQKLTGPAPRLDPTVRAELTALLADEISELEEISGRDLSAWRAQG